MDLIPLIHMKKKKIHIESKGESVSLDELLSIIKGEKKIYILDWDGIEKDRPNLCTYQRIPDSYELWVDFGPREIGDIVDATMAGAANITLRKELCPQLFIPDIKEISENKIYTVIDFNESLSSDEVDGLVNFTTRNEIDTSFKYGDLFKSLALKNKIFSFESDFNNQSYWKRFGAQGLLVETNKLKEFKDGF